MTIAGESEIPPAHLSTVTTAARWKLVRGKRMDRDEGMRSESTYRCSALGPSLRC